jgi:hypothetical protein
MFPGRTPPMRYYIPNLRFRIRGDPFGSFDYLKKLEKKFISFLIPVPPSFRNLLIPREMITTGRTRLIQNPGFDLSIVIERMLIGRKMITKSLLGSKVSEWIIDIAV